MRLFNFVAIALFASGAHAQNLDFKGVPFGSSSDIVRERLYESIQNWYCKEYEGAAAALADRSCFMGNSTYAARPIRDLTAHFYSAGVAAWSMKFTPRDYTDIRGAITEKYGKPKESTSIVRANSGASFDQLIAVWTIRGGTISLQKYAERIDEGMIWVSSSEHNAEFARRLAAKPKAKSDI